jgi:hypothetical protein
MKLAIAAILGTLCSAPAWAQDQDTSLNLDLPSSQAAAASSSGATTASDPPGKYYGDVGGKDDLVSNTKISGTVSTTVGYAKGYGTGFATAADLNMSTQLKDGTLINVNIGVSRSDGMPGRWGRAYGRGYGGYGGGY